jgi:hypothetical protein
MNFIIPLLVVGSLAFVASRKINRLGNLRVQFKDLANVKISLLQTSLDLRINLINPEIINSIPTKIRENWVITFFIFIII